MGVEEAGIENRAFEDGSPADNSSAANSKTGVHGPTISFHDITYKVEVKERRKKFSKTILENVSGVFKPGMNAILGPTGGGKTSLLDILAARKDPQGLSGVVLVDGHPQPRNFRLVSGYVVQDDVIMGTLSVRENLMFSAALRLPESVSKQERIERVEGIIEELGLETCADTKIGTPFIRGVSGGERKRTNVGMELVTQPGVLFLDEPTTGLDAATAVAVVEQLARLSQKGRTIIFSIHQPRYSIFRYFDHLHLFSVGQTVYHGSAKTALNYFSKIGFDCDAHDNPADFFLDTISSNERMIQKRESQTADVAVAVVGINNVSVDSLRDVFKQSDESEAVTRECEAIIANAEEIREVATEPAKIEYATSFFRQLGVLSARAIKNVIRNPFIVFAQNGILLIFAIMAGLIYFQMDLSPESGIQNRMGAFLFLCIQQIFANMSSLDIFVTERAIFVHETASGFYRVSPYFLGKVFADLLPLRLIPVVIYATITYWMMGLKAEADSFFIFQLTLVLTSFVATGVAFTMSSTFRDRPLAAVTSGLVYLLSLIFGGVLLNIASLPEWIRWIQYLSLFRYSINALSINEFVGLDFCNGTTCMSGEEHLMSQDINFSAWGLWQNHVALSIFVAFFFTLAYIQLRRTPKYK